MLDSSPVITHEYRPVERRGKKRASPLIESQATLKDAAYRELLDLLTYSVTNRVRVV